MKKQAFFGQYISKNARYNESPEYTEFMKDPLAYENRNFVDKYYLGLYGYTKLYHEYYQANDFDKLVDEVNNSVSVKTKQKQKQPKPQQQPQPQLPFSKLQEPWMTSNRMTSNPLLNSRITAYGGRKTRKGKNKKGKKTRRNKKSLKKINKKRKTKKSRKINK